MTHFFVHAAILIWSMIATLVGGAVLLVVIGFLAHEFFVGLTNAMTKNNPDTTQEN